MSLEHAPERQGVRGRFGRFARIPVAVEYGGISRSGLYLLAPKHEGLFVKHGYSTLVNLEILDTVLDALPAAKIKAPPKRKRSAGA